MEIARHSAEAVCLTLEDPSRVGEARRHAQQMAEFAGLNEADAGRAALVATELATNLAKHAQHGEMLIRPLRHRRGVEILSIDRGPGIERLSDSLRDGYSTTGTPGHGLGCVVRQSDVFDIHTEQGMGTVLSSVVLEAGQSLRPELGVISRPHPGETVCGDAWSVDIAGGRTRVLVVDGLGHGLAAHTAAREAVRIFEAHPAGSADELMQLAHAALRSTRGAAMAVALISQDRVEFCGVGNISAVIVHQGKRHNLVSHPGTVGMQIRKTQTNSYPWGTRALLIVHSDGLGTHWQLDKYAGLTEHRPSVIAGVLYRDYSRGRDDVTVLALRGQEGT
jgi:anti-sigma regulatory factor (Ser/Thr protein kinase)